MATRILIADDSPTARTLMESILDAEPDLQVVGFANNGLEAVQMVERLEPDLVLMDVHMPVLDGIAATREIMSRLPTPIVIVSAVSQRDVDLSLTATQAGALIALPKPDSPGSARFPDQRAELVSMVRAMAQVKVVRRWAGERRAAGKPHRRARPDAVDVVVVAASTGGPAALRQLIGALPGGFPAPVLVVQHIARDFTSGFAHWLATDMPLAVKLAEAGEELRTGVVYIAPDNAHLGVAAGPRVELSHGAPIAGFRPSATHLFESAARTFGHRALAVIMTGMGSDGADGLVSLHDIGGYVIGQNEASSIVFGMAREAWDRGAVDELLPLDRIAPRIVELVSPRSES